jgi:RNA polymerase sigma-70 factor (ECF subfamily)
MTSEPSDATFSVPDALIAELYDRAQPARWGVSRETFQRALERSCAHHFGPAAAVEEAALRRFLASLHVEDLALACGCRAGNATAWEYFMRVVQPSLEAAGRAVAGPGGHELADNLIGELYGTTVRHGERRALFDYFHGRSRLSTWLRTVVAQRHVDALRLQRRSVPLDEALTTTRAIGPAAHGGRLEVSPAPAAVQEAEARIVTEADREQVITLFERELTRAIGALSPDDRLRLSYYYVHGRKLSEIGRLMREHESTVSRKLERVRRELRETVEAVLMNEHGLARADLQQCYQEASKHGTLDVETLLGADEGR